MTLAPFMRRAALLAAALGAALLSACSPAKLLDRAVPRDTYDFEGGVAYGTAPRQKLDVFLPLPTALPAAGRRPLVVFFFGGAWTTGDRATFRFVGEALASRGAVVVLPDYGLSPAFRYPVFVQDSALAVKWALDNAQRLGADPKQVYVMGHSAGAYNAAMVALDDRWLGALGSSPRQLAGWIGLAGPYDFLPIENPDAKLAFDWPNTLPESQPLRHVTSAAPRTLLMAVGKDTLVNPIRNTRQMAEHLRAAGVDVQVQEFDDLGHVTLIANVAKPLHWLGGPVLPPIVKFLGLP
ncbi:alpha/beta hydrolase [Variovorax robiniae]|uniref:Alpha/beta hydrolase n=1 Tax=Variovorax robiniae TaxID=1836199 RepID=A0ABU8XDH6_9BURK